MMAGFDISLRHVSSYKPAIEEHLRQDQATRLYKGLGLAPRREAVPQQDL